MKQILQRLAFSLLLVSATTSMVSAQSPEIGKATINSDMIITLDATAPLVSDYAFDFSAIALKDKEAAERFFRMGQDNLMSYSLNYDTKIATVHIRIEYMQPRGWGVNEYNQYFIKLADRYRNNLKVVNE